MAQQITKGSTPEDGRAITHTILNGLVDDASLLNLEESAHTSGVKYFKLSKPGSPAEGDIWPDATDNRHRVRVGTQDQDINGTIVMTNASGTAMSKGNVVAFQLGPDSSKMDFCTDADAEARVIGVVDDASIADGASGRVMIQGVTWITVTNESTTTDSGSKRYVYANRLRLGEARVLFPENEGGLQAVPNYKAFARLLSNVPSQATLYTALVKVFK